MKLVLAELFFAPVVKKSGVILVKQIDCHHYGGKLF